jgi:hypothetical protein
MFWSGYARLYAGADLRSLEQSAQDLSDHARRHSLDAHWALGVALRGLCRSRLMDFEGAVSALTEGIQGLVTAHYGPVTPLLMAELAHARAKLGEIGAGLDVIARCEAEESHADIWCTAEVLRRKGELMELRDGEPTAVAEECLVSALSLARKQGALAWELRCAQSLGHSYRVSGRTDSAFALLDEIYGKFTEGFGSPDLVAAMSLLESLSSDSAHGRGRP